MSAEAAPATGVETALIDPVAGTLKTEYSANARSKCQLCHMKISKDAWRMLLAVCDQYHPHGDGRPRIMLTSAHASCYFDSVTHPVDLRNSTQSTPYNGTGTNPAWSCAPKITYPATEEGELIGSVLVTLNSGDTLIQSLPTPALQACHTAAVTAAVAGADTLNENHRNILELFCLHKKLTDVSRDLVKMSDAAEAEFTEHDSSGDPLKSKFTQYSPNSMAHCRDCHQLLVEGAVRVGAHVFSSSSRHAGFSINYWCLECMCARPSVRRMSRLYPMEIERVLPGAELLAEADLQRVCALLGIAPPDPAALAALADGRIRATRSGRKFNTWGGPSEEAVAAVTVATADGADQPLRQNKRARR